MIYNSPEYWLNKKRNTPKHFLTFVSPEVFLIKTSVGSKIWDGVLEYSTDTETWIEWDGSEISAVYGDNKYALYFRGTGNTIITGGTDTDIKYLLITGADIQCSGNIETLLDYATVESGKHPTMASGCYHSMFNGCTALTQAPSLPATTLASSCYHSMFRGCTALTQAPSLPATTLAKTCYYSMFNGCKKIKLSDTKTEEYTQDYRIPVSGTGTTASRALTSMFSGTGGTFKSTPQINKTYYLSSSNTIV